MFSLFNLKSPPANYVNTIVPGTGSVSGAQLAAVNYAFLLVTAIIGVSYTNLFRVTNHIFHKDAS